jgi:hypothetical protein
MIIIGLTGHAGSGKSTVAKTLEKHHGFQILKFADPLKNMFRQLAWDMGCDDGTVEAMIDGSLKENSIPIFGNKTPRHIMQTLGTEWGRGMVDEDIWVKAAKFQVVKLLKYNDPRTLRIVFDDVRFPNEAELICGWMSGTLAKVMRKERVTTADHPSENARIHVDKVLYNYGDMETLEAQAESLFAFALHKEAANEGISAT